MIQIEYKKIAVIFFVALTTLYSSLAQAQINYLEMTCSWVDLGGGTPQIFSRGDYSSSATSIGTHIQITSELTYPDTGWEQHEWVLLSGGGYQGHDLTVYTNETWSIYATGAIGRMDAWGFGGSYFDTCAGTFSFDPPHTTATISDTEVEVGDPVVITWDTYNDTDPDFETLCYHNGVSAPSDGVLSFTATHSHEGSYSIDCENIWGNSPPVTVYLTVNDPTPDCPAVPTSATDMNLIYTKLHSPPSYKIGHFERGGNPSVTVEAYCAGSEWKLKVTEVDQPLTIHANLDNLSTATIYQITHDDISEATSCSTLNLYKNSLEHYASQTEFSLYLGGGWYDEDAVYAHEEVHGEQFRTNLTSGFNLLKSTLETSSEFAIPLSSAMDAAAAKSILTGISSDYSSVISQFNVDSNGADYPLGHTNASAFTSVQHAAIAPYMNAINSRLSNECP